MHSPVYGADAAPRVPPGVPSGNFPQSCVEMKPGVERRRLCRIVRQAAWEMFCLFSGKPASRRNCRHAMLHIRQIAMYVCHAGLSMPVTEVAICFGRDAATIRASCLQVEERREEPGFDDFVSAVERLSKSVAQILEVDGHAARN